MNSGILPDHMIKGLSMQTSRVVWTGDEYIEENLQYVKIVNKVQEPLILPYFSGQQQPASYDVRLSNRILVPTQDQYKPIDLRNPEMKDRYREADISEGFPLTPGRFVLGATIERVCIPDWMVCRVDGKSGLARLGIQIHSAGFVDPGYEGDITLELVNFSPETIVLWPDVLIAQLEFIMLVAPCWNKYKGKHQGGVGAVGSRYDPKLVA